MHFPSFWVRVLPQKLFSITFNKFFFGRNGIQNLMFLKYLPIRFWSEWYKLFSRHQRTITKNYVHSFVQKVTFSFRREINTKTHCSVAHLKFNDKYSINQQNKRPLGRIAPFSKVAESKISFKNLHKMQRLPTMAILHTIAFCHSV